MRVIVVGAGEVGETIAASLAPAHEVAVVDVDRDTVESLEYSLDVLAVDGDGTALSTLMEAGVEAADILIACTDDDETNLVTCSTAKTVSDPFTFARVKDVKYLRTWERSPDVFGVDHMVCTNLTAARDVVRVIGLPGARDVDPFVGGLVQMAEFDVGPESPVAGQAIRDADRWGSLTFAALLRGEDVIIPRGDTIIRAGDRVVVIGSPESVRSSAMAIAPGATDVDDIAVFGGSRIGYHVARLLQDRDIRPRLIEQDPERARELAEDLTETVVLRHDATDVDFLSREGVPEADVVVAALENDQQNLLVCMLANRLGVERTVAIVETGDYVDLFEATDVDVAINPRRTVAEEITRFTLDGSAENIAVIEDDRAEVLEIEVDDESVLAGRAIRDAVQDLPASFVIGAITRDGELVTPRGDTVVQPGDHVVLFVETDDVDAVAASV